MNKHKNFTYFLSIIVGFSFSTLLASCAGTRDYEDEPQLYSSQVRPPAISYLSLAFPHSDDEELALQIALVKYRYDAIEQERWLLRNEISYQWILVELKGDVLNLLVAGPYEVGPALTQKRMLLQRGLGYSQGMPVMALGL
jgi:hypothetical protein